MSQPDFAPVPFGIAAAVADLTNKQLRGWLDRKVVTLEAEDRAGGWRRFTWEDCNRLALIATLSRFCVPVSRADEIAEYIYTEYPLEFSVIWRRDRETEIGFTTVLFVYYDHETNNWQFTVERSTTGLPTEFGHAFVAVDIIRLQQEVRERIRELTEGLGDG